LISTSVETICIGSIFSQYFFVDCIPVGALLKFTK